MADLKTTNIYGDAYINNKVGIATNAPATRLQIGQLSPTAATEGIQFGDDTSTRIYRNGAGSLILSSSISTVGTITSTYGTFSAPGISIGDAQYGFYITSGNLTYKSAAGGAHYWRNIANSANTLTLDNSGNLTAAGTITAPSATISGYITFPNDTNAAGLINTAGTAWLKLDDAYGNMYIVNNQAGAGIYFDSNAYYWRNSNGATTLLSLSGNGDLGAARYLSGTYVNTSDDVSTGNITHIVAKFGDNYHRSATAAKVAAFISGQTMNIVGTSTNITAYTINQNVGTANSPTFAGLILSPSGTSQFQLNSPSGTQGLWIRAGYDTDGTATPISSANNITIQSSGNNSGTFSFVCGNTKILTIAPGAVNSLVALQQSGNQVLHAGNYNSYAVGLSTNNTLTGTNVQNSPNNTFVNTVTNANQSLTFYQATSGADAYMTFHIGSDFAGYFGLGGAENDLVWGGWSVGNYRYRILHSGNASYAWNMNQNVRTTDNPTFANPSVTGITITNLTGAYQNTSVYDSAKTQSATPSRGIRAPASSIQFTDSYAIAPFYTYRSTGDWPVPYGIGWGTGGESSGIFQRYASNGSSFGDMIFYTGNDGFGAFSFRRHTWEGTAQLAAGSGELNTELFRVDWAGKATAISFGLTGGFIIDANGAYGQFNNWVHLPGYHGLYSSNNGAHFYPNNANYGSWRIAGSRNSWYGLEFDSGVCLMMNSSEVGFYRVSSGWQMRWYAGTGYVYKGNPGGGTEATILDSINASYAWNMNQNVRTTDNPTFGTLQLTRLNFGATGAAPYNSAAGEGTGNGITFGGDEAGSGYRIFTTMENVGGNYSKLTLNWHTGIRIGAYTNYGGVRFYNNSFGTGTEIFSVGNLDSNVRVVNNLIVNGITINQERANNARMYGAGTGAFGLLGLDSAGSFRWQIYGESGNYGFLDSTWGAWDIKKVPNGELDLRVSSALVRVLNAGNAPYAYNMNQYVRTTDTCSFAGLTVSNTINGSVTGNAGTVTNGLYTTGGQTIAGITYFSNGESINAYGIRGRFTNEYLHLYNKVGVGHPGGWGAGESSTPDKGLSTYGGLNIAYGDNGLSTFNGVIRANSNIRQGADLAMPLSSWSVSGTSTGMVIFSFPGNTGNYGMVHCVFDIYEYNSNTVSTVIVGGHNWSGAWYNFGANVIGRCGKSVRLGVKDSKFCVVFGGAASSWEYGTIILRKIHNGGFYTGIMDMGGSFTTQQTTTESFSNISGDLRALRTSADFIADGGVTGTSFSGAGTGLTGTASSLSIGGNAATATTLQTARNINGTSFNGSAAITTATWGTARTLTIGSTGKSVDGSAAITWSLAEIGAAATNQTMFVGTTSVAINRASAAQTLTGVNIDGNAGNATYAMRLDSPSRSSFTVGGNKDTYYPVIFNIGGGSTVQQYSEFVIERGGYDDPGYTGIGFSTLNIRFSCKASGWGFGATYENVEMHGYTTQMVANWQQMSEASKLIVWLRGATIYNFWNVVANTTLHDGNSGGTSLTLAQAPNYSYTYAPTATVQTKALYGKYINSSTGTSGIYVAGNVLAEGLFSGPGTGLTGTAAGLSIGGNAATVTNGLYTNSTLTAGNLSGTIPSGVLGNSTVYIGTTAVALNRASAAQTLTGISIDGNAATAGGLAVHGGTNNEANKIVRTDGNGYINAGWINTPSGDMPDTQSINRIYCSDDQYIRYKGVADFKQQIGLTYKNATPRSVNTTDTNYWTGVMGWNTTDFNTMITWGSGFIDSWSSPGNSPGAGFTHFVGLQALHYTNGDTDGTDNYGYQLVAGSGVNSPLFLRVNWGSAGSWKTMLDSLNFNSYSPSLTGNGASGTWSINVTGNAGTATSATTATALNSSNYIARCGSSGNYNTDFQNTPAGSVRHLGDDYSQTNCPLGSGWWFLDNYRHSNGSNYWGVQVAWGWEDQANKLATRNVNNGSFGSWIYYLNSGNYTDYTVTKTGTGASGTWGINITGNAGGSSTSCTGNATTATTLQTARNIGGVSFNGSADINLPGVNTAGNQNTSGNAATATNSTQLGGVVAARYVRNDTDGTAGDLFSLITVTKSLTVTTSWLDTGISAGSDLVSGAYILTLNVDNYGVSGGHYNETYTGIMYWYAGSTNSTDYDEIPLHKSGHAPNTRYINLRTLRGVSGVLKLQIISSVTTSGASNYIFKFRRMI